MVVTIIVLLIVSTISIQALTGSGLFKQTKQFNQNTKIKEFFKKSIKLKINSKD